MSGIGEYRDQIQAGELRVLAVTGRARIPGVDAPTLREAGVDVEFTNWRGVVAPPGIGDGDRDRLVRFGLPVLPAVLGVILGPAAEQQMRRALQLSDGALSGLVNTTFSVVVYVVVAAILLWPLVRRVKRVPEREKV
ncbi:Tripartite tricarboxylate transporter family receptor [Actinokineospora iranica]|uniref:Tripartite tricarboxylate transporter family receptor n=1 Tax=Actinokineospora iranica TaxID=1271860 RepID=A0A1G6QBD7_9PSEU|nr:Tripartite tricarboxylate transporter family receptor [Actinokineospora iranica]